MNEKNDIGKNFWAVFQISIIIMILVLILGGLPASATGENSHEDLLIFTFNQPIITEVNISNESYDKVMIDGLPTIDYPDKPILPVKPINELTI